MGMQMDVEKAGQSVEVRDVSMAFSMATWKVERVVALLAAMTVA